MWIWTSTHHLISLSKSPHSQFATAHGIDPALESIYWRRSALRISVSDNKASRNELNVDGKAPFRLRAILFPRAPLSDPHKFQKVIEWDGPCDLTPNCVGIECS